MKRFVVTVTLFSMLALVNGCGETSAPAPSASSQTGNSEHGHEHATEDGHDHAATGHAATGHDEERQEGHSHGAAPHGGTLTDWGGGAYHVEFTVDHDKKEATVYIIGSDAKSPQPIQAESIQLVIDDPMTEMELIAQPLEGEAAGMSSRFVATHDTLGIVKEFSGTLSGQFDGTAYTGDFREVTQGNQP